MIVSNENYFSSFCRNNHENNVVPSKYRRPWPAPGGPGPKHASEIYKYVYDVDMRWWPVSEWFLGDKKKFGDAKDPLTTSPSFTHMPRSTVSVHTDVSRDLNIIVRFPPSGLITQYTVQTLFERCRFSRLYWKP